MPTALELARVNELLKEGKVQEAHDLQARLIKDAADTEAAAAGRVPEPPPPRPANIILRDILIQIGHELGNRPALEALLREYEEAEK